MGKISAVDSEKRSEQAILKVFKALGLGTEEERRKFRDLGGEQEVPRNELDGISFLRTSDTRSDYGKLE